MASRLARIIRILERVVRILASAAWILLPPLMTIYIASQCVFLLFPLYIFGGDAEGFIGILSYRLEVFQHPVRSPALDSLAILAIPVIISMPIAMIAVLSRFVKHRIRSWLALGGAGVAVVASGISMSLRNVASLVASQVAGNYSHSTSAGYIFFQGVSLTGTVGLHMPLIAYLSSTVSLILIAVHIVYQPRGRSS